MLNPGTIERRAFCDGLRDAIAPRMSISAWAEKYRVLSKVSSAEHGRWSNKRTPYLVEIMDCLSEDNPVHDVVLQAATQLGKTETGNNWVGEFIANGNGAMMIVLPTSAGAKKSSKTRITPMINDTPILAGRVRDAKSRDSGNTTLMKEFGNGAGVLVFAGANSANDLKSTPAGKLFLDEIEEYPDDVDGQGDPEKLALKRADTFQNYKTLKVSTPTIVGGRIDRAYRASDQRLYFVPCPHCGHRQTLIMARLHWTTRKVWQNTDPQTGEVIDTDPDTAGAVEHDTNEILDIWYQCEGCSDPIHEHYKTQMLADGEWRAMNPGPDRAAGFKISALYSPIGWFGWRKIILDWIASENDMSGRLKKTFTNTVLGEAYEEPGEAIEHEFLKKRVEKWRINSTVPAKALVLFAGVDVQGDRLEARVWGYGRNRETWLCRREIIFGAPELPATWAELDELLNASFDHELGGRIRIAGMGVDSSDGKTTQFVRAFARKWAPTRRVFALKGQAVPNKPIIGRPVDKDVAVQGKIIEGGVKIWPMGSDTGKGAFYSMLRIESPGPGYVHLPSGLPEDEFKQMVAERMQTRYIRGHPKVEWILPSGRRNEALDCRVMADAVAEAHGIDRVNLDRVEKALTVVNAELDFNGEKSNEDAPPAETKPAPPANPPAPVNSPFAKPRSGFVNNWRK